ncbi:hypothetical protein PHLGIDRAFT_366338 [Phlebiopsis gigantea 11061_1 CR5-6]|uniref:Uncharacterized protein n=1 Tax=Phlebiopsis gigantea (strain 11061_1 CR5-6) TaxID=745531 RepID=A0A0C3SCB5_PHLG1|nr:hypothetical protein PHLGIDRAFT_366338 [Phlebiopsis gigantea 11061_1 CR5-6]
MPREARFIAGNLRKNHIPPPSADQNPACHRERVCPGRRLGANERAWKICQSLLSSHRNKDIRSRRPLWAPPRAPTSAMSAAAPYVRLEGWDAARAVAAAVSSSSTRRTATGDRQTLCWRQTAKRANPGRSLSHHQTRRKRAAFSPAMRSPRAISFWVAGPLRLRTARPSQSQWAEH